MYPGFLADKIGCGTDNPQRTLHVKGSLQIDGSSQPPPPGTVRNLQGASQVDLIVRRWLTIYVDGEMYCMPLFTCPITLKEQ